MLEEKEEEKEEEEEEEEEDENDVQHLHVLPFHNVLHRREHHLGEFICVRMEDNLRSCEQCLHCEQWLS